MAVLVTVPWDCLPGQAFSVHHGHQEFNVICPEDCFGGYELEIDLPLEAEDVPNLVDVVVPPHVVAGEEFLVELADGATFFVVVPEHSQAGDQITIEVPAALEPPQLDAGDENMPPYPCDSPSKSASYFRSPAICSRRASREVPSANVRSRGASQRASREDLHQWAAAAQHEAPFAEPLCAGPVRIGRFFDWQVVEVERNDGSRSRCTAEFYDEGGDTYSVRLLDGTGRSKHFVENDELYAIRCGSFLAGAPVLIEEPNGAAGPAAQVESFDEESGSYTVRLANGSCRFYVMEEELRERH